MVPLLLPSLSPEISLDDSDIISNTLIFNDNLKVNTLYLVVVFVLSLIIN
ncbi:hypothetical protein VCRA2127O450_320007 [Vibrio crassostreae]|nr:hypothetical protein VCRA2119O432_310007 [Vibrio crassostreae]CAK2023680.1 hypothetical protein VCRA2117O428_320009 [Vibrio crassostreae]CAK2025099.1 hypothetical protein VCRA2113O416_330009 [Vibrio crassostreae]CAK2345440.1 hypothetical protein VCRA2113O410_300007 [Vibrio crassostreae]CAK2485557.1 hypothetical protein VCRA2113O417_310007 [Vibrio crassostreae]